MIKVDSSRGALLLLHHPAVEVYEALQPGQKFNRRARQSSVERRAPEPADVLSRFPNVASSRWYSCRKTLPIPAIEVHGSAGIL